jgi:hypothetical protein
MSWVAAKKMRVTKMRVRKGTEGTSCERRVLEMEWKGGGGKRGKWVGEDRKVIAETDEDRKERGERKREVGRIS